MLGYSADCGGLFVSGGNMANLVCFLAARQAKAGHDMRKEGLRNARLRVYCSSETHAWVPEGGRYFRDWERNAIRWIATNDRMQIDTTALRQQIADDLKAGERTVFSSSARPERSVWAQSIHYPRLSRNLSRLEPLVPCRWRLRRLCLRPARRSCRGLWPACARQIRWPWIRINGSMRRWRQGARWCETAITLRDAFAYHPPDHHFGTEAINYFDLGPQNSRGLSGAQGLARHPTGGSRRLCAHDL